MAIEWERAGQLGREGVLTEALSREVIGGILARTTGESLRVVSVRDHCMRWLQSKEQAKREATTKRYAGTIDRFLKFLERKADRPINAVPPPDCQSFYDYLLSLKLAPATLVVEIKTIRGVFKHALRLGLIPTNPAAVVELPERIRQVQRKAFSPGEIQVLLDTAEPEWKTAILLGYYGGLRLSDAVGLTWNNVDFSSSKLTLEVHKTGETLEVPLHPVLESHLSNVAGDATGLVCSKLGHVPVGGRSGLSKQFLSLMKQSGIDNQAVDTGGQRRLSQLSFHALRTSFNSALHNNGVSQELRKKLTGHKSNSVNDRYTRTELTILRTAVSNLPTLRL